MSVPEDVRPWPRRADEVRATEVDEGLWQLVLPLGYAPDLTVNAYLVELRDGWCLVDTGSLLAPGWDGLARGLALAGVEPQALRLVVATHPHEDHYGLAAEILERTGAELALGPGPLVSADVLRDPPIPWEERVAACRRAGVPEDVIPAAARHPGNAGDHPRPEPDRLLREGEAIEARRGTWRVVAAPGHSPAQVVLFEERTHSLLSADLVLGGRIPYLEYGFSPDPWTEQVASLARVRPLGIERLLPGHGPVTVDVERSLDWAENAIQAAPGRLLASIERQPRSAYEAMVDALGPDATFYQRHAALAGALSVLEHLVAHGAADADEHDGVRRYSSTGRSFDTAAPPL